MIKVGQKVRFNPHKGINGVSDVEQFNNTEGTVMYINNRNRWFSVEYGEAKLRMAFNFNDLGKSVKVC